MTWELIGLGGGDVGVGGVTSVGELVKKFCTLMVKEFVLVV